MDHVKCLVFSLFSFGHDRIIPYEDDRRRLILIERGIFIFSHREGMAEMINLQCLFYYFYTE